jgi:16S rRNA (cytosine1402-N4)-methyltransferase
MSTAYHTPVLCDAAVRILVSEPSWTYVDGTLGGGGHAEAICRRLSESGHLIACDRDEDALVFSRERLARYAGVVRFVHTDLGSLGGHLRSSGPIGGLLLDLGVSSYQLDEGSRGFSFQGAHPLDMRMDRRQQRTAAEVVNASSEKILGEILFRYGEERSARRIARVIVARRPMQTTAELRRAVEEAVGPRFLVKSLARVFQALRIEVNQELNQLRGVLETATPLLRKGGRVVVISYHSLEDRIVKEFFRREAAGSIPSGHPLLPDEVRVPVLRILTRRPLVPGFEEVADNPRARSAKLRAAEKETEAGYDAGNGDGAA